MRNLAPDPRLYVNGVLPKRMLPVRDLLGRSVVLLCRSLFRGLRRGLYWRCGRLLVIVCHYDPLLNLSKLAFSSSRCAFAVRRFLDSVTTVFSSRDNPCSS